MGRFQPTVFRWKHRPRSRAASSTKFGEVDSASIQTKVSLQVELMDRKTNRNVWDRVVEREEPVSSKSVTDVVQSLDRNLQRVVSETAAKIDKFLAATR